MTEPAESARVRTPVAAWIAVLSVTALAGGAIAFADRPPDTAPRGSAEALLPPDGAARLIQYQDGSEWLTESARTTGVLFLLQQPPATANQQLSRMAAEGVDGTQTRFWRQTFTDPSRAQDQVSELYELAADGVRLLTVTGTQNGFSYSPGVLVLPTGVHDGSVWTSSGDAYPESLLQYQATGSATAANDGCLVVDSTMRYLDPDQGGAEVYATSDTSTWCPGQGQVSSRFVNGDVAGSATSIPLKNGHFDAPAATAAASDFSGYADWTSRDLHLLDTDPLFGDSELLTTTDSTSATTPSGVAVFNTGVDVAAYRVDGNTAERAWLARAGGQVLWLTTVGETVLVGTTERKLVAYDSGGWRLWSIAFDDVLGAVPTSDGEGGLLVQVLGGELVRISLDDGSERWRTRLGDDSDVAPITDGTRVYAADRAGGVSAFDLATGTRIWTENTQNPAVIVSNGERVFVASADGAVDARDASTGALLWTQLVAGIPDGLVVTDDRVVVQSDETTVAWDLVGTRQWTVAAADGLASDGERILVVGQGNAVLVDSDANQLASWVVPAPDLAFQRRLIQGPSGFWIVGSDFVVTAVGE